MSSDRLGPLGGAEPGFQRIQRRLSGVVAGNGWQSVDVVTGRQGFARMRVDRNRGWRHAGDPGAPASAWIFGEISGQPHGPPTAQNAPKHQHRLVWDGHQNPRVIDHISHEVEALIDALRHLSGPCWVDIVLAIFISDERRPVSLPIVPEVALRVGSGCSRIRISGDGVPCNGTAMSIELRPTQKFGGVVKSHDGGPPADDWGWRRTA